MIGICGNNCTYCPRYIATQNGGLQELDKVKELWVHLGLRDPDFRFPIKDMACQSCMSENKCAYTELHSCVRTKELENCGSCDKYPCELINAAFNKSDILKVRAIEVCTAEEMDMLNRAFFSKKEYLDHIQRQHKYAYAF